MRKNHLYTYKGKEYTVEQLSKKFDLPLVSVYNHLDNGKTVEEISKIKRRKPAATLTYEDKTMTFKEWSKETGIKEMVIRERHKLGWPIEEILGFKPHGTKVQRVGEDGRIEKLYQMWIRMRTKAKKNNLKVAPEFEQYNDFRAWAMENGYSPELTIIRKDIVGDYTMENTAFGTKAQFAREKKNARLLEYNGEIETLRGWGEKLNIEPATIAARLNRGLTPGQALGFENISTEEEGEE